MQYLCVSGGCFQRDHNRFVFQCTDLRQVPARLHPSPLLGRPIGLNFAGNALRCFISLACILKAKLADTAWQQNHVRCRDIRPRPLRYWMLLILKLNETRYYRSFTVNQCVFLYAWQACASEYSGVIASKMANHTHTDMHWYCRIPVLNFLTSSDHLDIRPRCLVQASLLAQGWTMARARSKARTFQLHFQFPRNSFAPWRKCLFTYKLFRVVADCVGYWNDLAALCLCVLKHGSRWWRS